jgi:hypothetical protein
MDVLDSMDSRQRDPHYRYFSKTIFLVAMKSAAVAR